MKWAYFYSLKKISGKYPKSISSLLAFFEIVAMATKLAHKTHSKVMMLLSDKNAKIMFNLSDKSSLNSI